MVSIPNKAAIIMVSTIERNNTKLRGMMMMLNINNTAAWIKIAISIMNCKWFSAINICIVDFCVRFY
jgi:hypothetical protein